MNTHLVIKIRIKLFVIYSKFFAFLNISCRNINFLSRVIAYQIWVIGMIKKASIIEAKNVLPPLIL